MKEEQYLFSPIAVLYYDFYTSLKTVKTLIYKNSDKKVILIMIKAMKRCISFSRYETIMKIYNEPILYSLRRNIRVKQPQGFLLLKI